MLLKGSQWKDRIRGGVIDGQLSLLYGEEAHLGKEGFLATVSGFEKRFGKDKNIALLSAPGRTELSGNHTDHQHGCVLCAAVTQDITAAAAPRGDMLVQVYSEDYGEIRADLSVLSVLDVEKGTSRALIRGIAKAITDTGRQLCGFDAYIRSNVPQGSGLSSSAAYEVLIGTIFNELFCGGEFSATEIAIFGQYAENNYFGKPCGLMDQMASATGGVVYINFKTPGSPIIQSVGFDFEEAGYTLCITNAGGSHADLTPDYSAIPKEMSQAALFFGKSVLREVDEKEFNKKLPELRKTLSDRAVLRSMHFMAENKRVNQQLAALRDGNIDDYLRLMNASGRSSVAMLQNVWSDGGDRSVALALGISDNFLEGEGAFRVHGGGFAGTIQAFVPSERAAEYKRTMDGIFGEGACCIMAVRPVGAYTIR